MDYRTGEVIGRCLRPAGGEALVLYARTLNDSDQPNYQIAPGLELPAPALRTWHYAKNGSRPGRTLDKRLVDCLPLFC